MQAFTSSVNSLGPRSLGGVPNLTIALSVSRSCLIVLGTDVAMKAFLFENARVLAGFFLWPLNCLHLMSSRLLHIDDKELDLLNTEDFLAVVKLLGVLDSF